MANDSTSRFSNRVEDYVKYRPNYPQAVIPLLQNKYRIMKDQLIADIGAGTGISSRLFLEAGYDVIGVEPNKEMREKSLVLLELYQNFKAIDGTAESTRLDTHSIDVVVAGQAFHWFDSAKTNREFQRILKKGGQIILLWNERMTKSPFEIAYDELIVRHGKDYVTVDHRNIDEGKIRTFFNGGNFTLEIIANW